MIPRPSSPFCLRVCVTLTVLQELIRIDEDEDEGRTLEPHAIAFLSSRLAGVGPATTGPVPDNAANLSLSGAK